MYAVIVTGGKQHKVQEGQTLKVEKIELAPGETVEFDKVLMVVDGEKVQVGAPYVEKCTVKASIKEHGRHDKVKIVKFKRRKHHMKQMGHRQWYTEVTITGIGAA